MKKNNNNAGPWRKDWPNARYRSPRQKIDAPTRTVIPQCPDTRPAAKFRIKKWQRKARAMAFRKQGRRNGRARVGAPSSARGKKIKREKWERKCDFQKITHWTPVNENTFRTQRGRRKPGSRRSWNESVSSSETPNSEKLSWAQVILEWSCVQFFF